MDDEPRQKLRELIVEYGRSICNDPNRCEALLKDYCGIHKREIFVLISALKKRVTDDLLKSSTGIPQEIVIGRLCKRLEDELAMTAEAAHWAVESWALALGVISAPLPIVKPRVQPKPPPVAASDQTAMSPPHRAEVLIAGRYRDNQDGTVTDAASGLQWMRFSLGQEWVGATCVGEVRTFSWQDALNAAQHLNRESGHAGHFDWRMPTEEELRSLVYCSSGRPKTWNNTGKACEGDYERPTIHQKTFPNTPSTFFWSGSSYAGYSDVAWSVDFNNGFAYVDGRGFGYGAVRLVRGG